MIKRRRRFKHPDSLTDRLEAKAAKLRTLAESIGPGPEREELFQKAEQCDRAIEVAGWLRASELRPPA
jgi:hypothetical protein